MCPGGISLEFEAGKLASMDRQKLVGEDRFCFGDPKLSEK